MEYYVNNMTRLFLATVFSFIVICSLSLAQGAPANDTLYLIARGPVNLFSIAWDREAKTATRTTLSSVPNSYSITNTFVDYDPVQSRLFWSTAPGKLFYRDAEGPQAKNNSLLVKVTPTVTDSIPFAVDDVTRLVYYAKATDTGSIEAVTMDGITSVTTDSGAIYAVTMDGKSVTEIVNVKGHSVQEIRADPENGYIFWLAKVSSIKSYIFRCDISGGNVLRIINGTSLLESFTLDRPRNVLYYVEGDNIKRTTYTGTPVTSPLKQSGLMTIQSAGDGILFGIMFSRSVVKMNNTGAAVNLPLPFTKIQVSNKGVDFYSPEAPPGSNKCTTSVHPCSHFCLPGPSQTFRCACPVDHIMEKDNKTCERLISCQAITAPDHSKIECNRSPDNRQLCSFKCDTGYIYHPRYTLTDLFECRSRVWYPQPNLQPCLAIKKPSGVRIYGNVTFLWTLPCNLFSATDTKTVQTAIVLMLTSSGGPLGDTCSTYICKSATPLLSCDESKNHLAATFHFDIEKTMNATEKLELNNNINASFAAVMVKPSQYNISVLGEKYPLVDLTFMKLGHRCPALSEDIGTGCVDCPAGTQFNTTLDVCALCPRGYYSLIPRSSRCNICGPHETTLREGATSSSECKEFCNPGLTFDLSTKSCKECEVGYYQDKTGIAPCRHCGDDKTTYGKGSKQASDCLDLCRPGYYHQNNTKSCQPCAKDTHQNKTWSYSCRKCPNGRITESTGAKSEADCYLLCHVGKFYDAKKGDCERCPANTYQDSDGTKSCVPCGDPLQSNPGSGSKSDCVYPNIIYGAVGGLGGVLLIIILIVSIVVYKKKCRRPKSDVQSGFATIDDQQLQVISSQEPWHTGQNGYINGGPNYPSDGAFGGAAAQDDWSPYESLQPVETRSRHERYQDGQGPFVKEPGAPAVPNQRYMSPEEWRESIMRGEDNHSGVYDELNEEKEDDYDKLRVDLDGPTWPAEAARRPNLDEGSMRYSLPPGLRPSEGHDTDRGALGTYVSMRGGRPSGGAADTSDAGEGAVGGPADHYMEPSVRHDDIQLNTSFDQRSINQYF